ncbi:DNA-binding response regulator [Sediminibacterium roseum]|uniref:DNA-binding response regulator n=1 Tax=Sediminibacterium roseum TaxID=1978412 RepID=A0ABW9ZTS6_9BACT|nr:LuxR C-terminal-related transcriptional regulator [Sediminibacterium roseum]NCI50409.1 DNA-binding response regulator [Sediminibacterium roseum]
MIGNFLKKHRIVLLYGSSMAVLLVLLKWLELRFVIYDHAMELYVGAIALVFTALGIWLALKLSRPKIKTVIIEKRVEDFVLNEKELAATGMSKRELEVLELMAEGLSNQEIAGRLFVSLNTVKTHSSNIFEKMDVQRRTQAVEKARRLNLIR